MKVSIKITAFVSDINVHVEYNRSISGENGFLKTQNLF